jgi:hypothetical protein
MSNAALDILRARQTAISNDVAIKMERFNELENETKGLLSNMYTLQSALETIKAAIQLLERDLPNESSPTRTTSKSKKVTS